MKMNGASKLGLALGGLGGIIAIGGLAYYCDSTIDNTTTLGALLLIAAMFFGLAGGFTKNAQWTPKGLSFFAFFTIAVVFAVMLTDYIGYLFAAAEIIIAAVILLISITPDTKRFLITKE